MPATSYRSRIRRYITIVFFLALVLCAVGGLAYFSVIKLSQCEPFSEEREYWWRVSSTFFAALTVLMFISFIVGAHSLFKIALLKKGRSGEEAVARILERGLPDTYYVLNSVKKNGGDVDHIVVGETGVFVVETKNYAGSRLVPVPGDKWLLDGEPVESPSLQVLRHIRWLRKVIGSKYPVYGIVVNVGSASISATECDRVAILEASKLPEFIKSGPLVLTQREIEQIVNVLSRYLEALTEST